MPETLMPDIVRRIRLIDGIPADIWMLRERQIGRFIKKYKIRPVLRRTMGVPEGVAPERMIDIDYIIGIRGGRKIPHLHYKGELYLLKAKQWREFSGSVVHDLSKRLSKSKQVNFNELIEISESISSALR